MNTAIIPWSEEEQDAYSRSLGVVRTFSVPQHMAGPTIYRLKEAGWTVVFNFPPGPDDDVLLYAFRVYRQDQETP